MIAATFAISISQEAILSVKVDEVVAPAWITRPAAEMPDFAAMIGLDGAVQLNCTATVAGRLTNCSVAWVRPAGVGFDRAALAAAAAARVSPKTIGGVAVESGMAFVTRFASEDIPEAPPPYRGPAPSDQALKLARQIIAAGDFPVFGRDLTLADVDADRRAEVRAMVSEMIPDPAQTKEWSAIFMTRLFSEDDLTRMARREPPRRSTPTEEELWEAGAGLGDEAALMERLRARYCQSFDC